MGHTLSPAPCRGFFMNNDTATHTAAIHEAGHALVGYLIGHLIERAFIGDDPEGDVEAGSAEGGIALRLIGDWRHAVFVGVAGWCAEEVSFPGVEADRGQDEDFCQDTLRQAGFSEWQTDAFIGWASTIVREQIEARRTTLEAVADWLMRYRDIDAETLAALIQAHRLNSE